MQSKYHNQIIELMNEMTLDEKIGQLNQMWFRIEEADTIKERLKNGEFGSIILCSTAFAGSEEVPMALREFLNELQKVAVEESRLKIPVIYARDIIHGHHTVLPIPLAMAASFNPDLVEKSYKLISKEAYNDGVRWTFAPMLDVSRDPRWGRIIESPGEDPYLGGKMAEAVVKGFQSDLPNPGSLIACAKHYLGYGGSEGGRDYHKAEFSEYSIRNYHMKAFKKAVDAGVKTVMSAFNEISGQPVSSSKYWMSDVLRDELGFEGMVISDWSAIDQLIVQGVAEDDKRCAEIAINAGVDMEMVDRCYIHHLKDLVKEGKVSEEVVDRAVYRVLKTKFEMGLFDRPYTHVVETDDALTHSYARKLTSECMVLLKNNDNLLPLKKGTKVYIIGNMADETRCVLGGWCLDGDESKTVTVRNGIAANDNFVITDNIEDADCIIAAMGESHLTTGEKHSLANIDFPDELLKELETASKLGKKIVGCLFFGRPIGLQKAEPYFDAAIYCWHPGTECGNALADILCGNVNPSGKLPATLPRTTGQIPLYYNCPPAARAVNEYYDKPGYMRNYLDIDGSPMYPFGYGLSYTTFEYSNLSAEKTETGVLVKVTVKNTGSVSGTEVAQCYVRDVCASMTRPLRELKGFEKLTLAPGEAKTVEFVLDNEAFGFYNAQNKFVVEPGGFIIYAGTDCTCENHVSINI